MNSAAVQARDVTVLELLDSLLDHGVVLAGDLTISVAEVDLLFLGLRVMLVSAERAERLRRGLDRGAEGGARGG